MKTSLAAIAVLALSIGAALATERAPAAGPIARQWHGKTTAANADAYEAYLGEAIKKFTTIPGNRGYQMLREDDGAVTHFSVISYWDSRASIHGYAGEDIRKTRALPRDPEFLIDPEPTVHNYELKVDARTGAH
jgi:heme-degrading monooxygenase HmoA